MKRFACTVTVLLMVTFAASAVAADLRIPIETQWPDDNPARQWPMTFGVPFAKGVVYDANKLIISDTNGKPVPSQIVSRHNWDDGSIRWAWVDFQPERNQQYAITNGNQQSQSDDIKLTQTDKLITVETGGAQYQFRQGDGCFNSLRLNDELISWNAACAFYAIDSEGRTARLAGNELAVESNGPRHTIVRIVGSYQRSDKTAIADAVVYFHFYAGLPQARISHRLIITKDTNKLWFREVGLKLPVQLQGKATATFNNKQDNATATFSRAIVDNQTLTMVQDEAPHFSFLNSKYRILDGSEQIDTGKACGNWVDLSTLQRGIIAQLPAMVEMFPTALSVGNDHLTVKFWASESGRELDFRTQTVLKDYFGEEWTGGKHSFIDKPTQARGTARVHDVWLFPHDGALNEKTQQQLGARTEAPFAMPSPKWIADSRVMGWWHPRDHEAYPQVEEAIDSYFTRGIFISQKVLPVNGYFCWGMYPFVAQGWQYKDGRWFPVVHRLSRGLEYNLRRGVWMLTARSADPRYYYYARRYTRYLGTMMFNHAPYSDTRDYTGYIRQQSRYFDSPIVWDTGAIAAFASSVDVCQFVYDYYLAADLHSRDVLELYKPAAMKSFDKPESIAEFFRPDSALRTLGSLYEYKHDQDVYDLCHGAMKLLAGRSDDEIINPTYRTNFGKAGDVFMGYYYYYSATGDELAADILKKLASLYFRDGRMVGSVGGRSIAMLPAAFAMVYRETKDSAYAAWMQQMLNDLAAEPTLADMGKTEADFGPTSPNSWDPMVMSGQSSLSVGAPIMMAALQGYTGSGQKLPVADKSLPIQPTVLLINRTEAKADTIVVSINNYGDRHHTVSLRDATGNDVQLKVETLLDYRVPNPVEREGFRWSWTPWYYQFETHKCLLIEIPASISPGVYELNLGDEVEYAVLYSTVDQMQQYAPNGIGLRRSERYFFQAPDGVRKVDVFTHRPVVFYDPSGKRIKLAKTRNGWAPLYLAGKPGIWSMQTGSDERVIGAGATVDTFIEFDGIPLVIAQGDPSRLFDVDLSQWRQTGYTPPRTNPNEPVVFTTGKYGQGALAQAGWIELPLKDEHFPKAAGTLEFWMQPQFSSTDFTMANTTQRLDLLIWDPIRLTYYMEPDNGGRTGRYSISRIDNYTMSADKSAKFPIRQFFQRGKWLHVAFTWNLDGRQARMNMFVNGRKRSHYPVETGSVAHLVAPDTNAGFWAPVGQTFRIGFGRRAGKGATGMMYDELRISDVVRYEEDFEPAKSAAEPDGNTILLMHMDGDASAWLKGRRIEGQIKGGRFLY